MKPVPDPYSDPSQGNKQLSMPEELCRVAVICSETLVATHYWPSAGSAGLVEKLRQQEQVAFDYFPVRYAGAGAAESVSQAFDKVEAGGENVYDVILLIGNPTGDTDIGIVHRVLAPRIARTPMPVLTALGPDDGETILGDTAYKVFASSDALLEFVSGEMRKRTVQTDEFLSQIRSLSQFLIAEHEVESKILLQAVLQPTLYQHLNNQTKMFEDFGKRLRDVASDLHLKLTKDEATLEHYRARISVELARIAENNASVAQPPRNMDVRHHSRERQKRVELRNKIDTVRTSLLFAYLCLLGVLWWWATPADTIFFGGSALVVFSAGYVAICNRLIDRAYEDEADAYDDDDATTHALFEIPTIDSHDVGRLQKSNRVEPWLK